MRGCRLSCHFVIVFIRVFFVCHTRCSSFPVSLIVCCFETRLEGYDGWGGYDGGVAAAMRARGVIGRVW